MKIRRNPIASAIKIALYSGLIASAAMTSTAYAQEEESTEKLDKVTVTGSRIKRSDVEGALPVTVITREQIELTGESNAGDLIRNLTFNSSGSFRPQSGSSAQGVAQVSLRGLGASRTLVLVDGRRMARSPVTGSSQDVNTIPIGAIERIEVLSDGASAVYGSDAIGGVINIITRTDFEGFQIMLGGAEVSIPANGGEREEGSVLFGASSDTSSIIAGVSWNDREIIFARDFPWNSPGGSVYGNSFTTIVDGNDQFNWRTVGGCDFPDTGFYTLGARCAYDFTLVSADEASVKNKSFYAKAKHQVNDNWEIWANASFSETSSFGRYAPVPDSSYFSTPLTANSPNNPTNPNGNVYDPSLGLDPQSVNWWHRFDALGNRDGEVTNTMTDLLLGTTGQINDVEVEFGVRHTDNRTSDVGRNYLLRSAAAALIESGAYSLANPYGSPESVLNSMKVTIFRDAKYDQDEVFGSAAFDMFEMEHGAVSAFVGASFRKDKYADIYDPLSEAGQIGGSAGNSAAGGRELTSVFFEALFPLMENLEMNLAGRYDDYDDFGDNFSPKISFRYQPLDNLTVRASYGEGFRAPTLPSLTQKPAFSATSVGDPQSCINQGQPENCSLQINDTQQSNPGLQAEDSKQFALGLAYEPTDWFNFTLDYYNIEIGNRIRSFGAQFLINSELAGDPLPPGLFCQRAPSGSIQQCFTGIGNQGVVETSGLDFNAQFNYEVLGGQVSTNFLLSHQLDQSVDGGRDFIKDPGTPEQRAVLSNTYSYGDWTVAYNINMIGDQYDYIEDGQGVGHVPTWVTQDLQVNYNTPWDGKIIVGVRNLTEKAPPIDLGNVGSRDYDFNLYDGYGRVTYLRYIQTF